MSSSEPTHLFFTARSSDRNVGSIVQISSNLPPNSSVMSSAPVRTERSWRKKWQPNAGGGEDLKGILVKRYKGNKNTKNGCVFFLKRKSETIHVDFERLDDFFF